MFPEAVCAVVGVLCDVAGWLHYATQWGVSIITHRGKEQVVNITRGSQATRVHCSGSRQAAVVASSSGSRLLSLLRWHRWPLYMYMLWFYGSLVVIGGG